MLRQDGSWAFYKIQHKQSDGQWVYSSFDYFGIPPTGSQIEDLFSACGTCWQQTGEDAVYDIRNAKAGLKWIKAKHPNYTFRLVYIKIDQLTQPVK